MNEVKINSTGEREREREMSCKSTNGHWLTGQRLSDRCYCSLTPPALGLTGGSESWVKKEQQSDLRVERHARGKVGKSW